jgi:predicted rRNA methylase
MWISTKNVVYAAIKAHRPIHQLYLSPSFKDKTGYELFERAGITPIIKDKESLQQVSATPNHQGICALVQDYEYTPIEELLDQEILKVVILDELSDPHNLGSVLRSAEAFGWDAVIIPNSHSVSLNGTVARTAAGSLEGIKVVQVSNIYACIRKLQQHQVYVYGTTPQGSKAYYEVQYPAKTALVLGAEGPGMRHLITQNCDELITIPMRGQINSLNVGVAAALIMAFISQ